MVIIAEREPLTWGAPWWPAHFLGLHRVPFVAVYVDRIAWHAPPPVAARHLRVVTDVGPALLPVPVHGAREGGAGNEGDVPDLDLVWPEPEPGEPEPGSSSDCESLPDLELISADVLSDTDSDSTSDYLDEGPDEESRQLTRQLTLIATRPTARDRVRHRVRSEWAQYYAPFPVASPEPLFDGDDVD